MKIALIAWVLAMALALAWTQGRDWERQRTLDALNRQWGMPWPLPPVAPTRKPDAQT